ncbi:mis18-binding protein 1 isoform X2 [Chelmon rostratus]|uniref:mis18-binding protein 1 isoform X2 n=1 Tax=Chelmon rostratus TaxID=109905 RepID=UPI001BE8C413|nr:mis18-binding protein 1 isoform X2 [Chelmon rostratus]
MASYHHLLQHGKPRSESPAKVFAKLKSKVQREGMCANERIGTSRDPQCNVGEKHGADFKSHMRKTENTWMTREFKENQRPGSCRNEALALTLSPISSPQKTYGYSDINNKPVEEMPPLAEIGHGCTPRRGAFLESTAVPQPLSPVSRKQIHTEPLQIGDLDGFVVTSRTPVKIQPVENDCVRSVFEEEGAPLMCSAYKFSPMRKRLRKRKLEPWGFSNISSNTEEISSEASSQQQGRKTSSEDDTHNYTCIDNLGHVRRFSAGRSEMSHFPHEAVFPPPRPTAKKRCNFFTEKVPPMSPAKMFAYMKEREGKTEQQEVPNVSSSMRHLFSGGSSHPTRDAPASNTHNVGEMQDGAFTDVPESVASVNRSRADLADNQSATDSSEDVLIPAVPSHPVLLEDPLILNSPRISIPQKNEAVFKRNKWSQATEFPSESVIYLKKWFLRRNHKGLFVDGIHWEDNIPWNSNIIVDRVSSSVLRSISGRVYILVGKMNLGVDSVFPKWLLKNFVNGFPSDWKALYEKFLSNSTNDTSRETERNSERRGIMAKTKPEASSINCSVKQQRQKPLKTSDSCPPASSSCTKTSRSGRVIKPPLEYWKGGRVILDADMNVTIHECYNTSICNPEITTTVSARVSQKLAHAFLPCSRGRKQCESSSNEEASVPLRRVKAPLRKSNRAKVNPGKKASYSPEPPVETLSTPEERPGRRTRSRQRYSAEESKPEKSSTQSKKQPQDTTRRSASTLRRKRTVPVSPESATVNDETSQDQSPSADLPIRRKTRGKGVHRKGGEKSQPSHTFLPSKSSESSEESGTEPRKRTRVRKNGHAAQTQTKQSKCTNASRAAKPQSTQSSRKHGEDKNNTLIPQEQDEYKWTEAELMKLQEAVSLYPKHMAGYWAKVARLVGTRSAEECHNQYTSQGTSKTPAKKARKPKKKKIEAPKDPDHPVISARAGTLKRKQQVRQFLENMPREDVDDVFSSAFMQNKRFEMPSMCPSDEHDFTLSDLEPMTPMSTGFPEVKTPQCLHITPGMMGSPNRSNDDKYVFQLQKRMKKRQFNVCKPAAPSKRFTPTPSVKRTMRRCANTENDTFVVWEMFPGNDGALSDSGGEEDFYFSDND